MAAFTCPDQLASRRYNQRLAGHQVSSSALAYIFSKRAQLKTLKLRDSSARARSNRLAAHLAAAELAGFGRPVKRCARRCLPTGATNQEEPTFVMIKRLASDEKLK